MTQFNAHTTKITTDATRLVALAQVLAGEGITHGAANVLAYVMAQPGISTETYDYAWDLFDHLESTICPRVIADARTFAADATAADLRAFLLELHADHIA